jgi:pimeloyl-ACP methyl ester carboxylesterase
VTAWLNTPIQTRFRTIDGLSIRYAESQDQRSDHALLLSPWPESLLAFEPTRSRLAEHTHLVAVDLPGFGHSQRRVALLSPRAMGEFVIRVADAFGLEHPHVVGPDVGTGPRCSPRPCIRAGCAAWSSAVGARPASRTPSEPGRPVRVGDAAREVPVFNGPFVDEPAIERRRGPRCRAERAVGGGDRVSGGRWGGLGSSRDQCTQEYGG